MLLLQAVYTRRKNALFRRAAELSVLCDCEVAIIMFGPDGELAQYSSSSMESTLRQYSRACTEPHETQTKSGMLRRAASKARAADDAAPRGGRGAPKRSRLSQQGPPEPELMDGEDTAEALMAMQDLPPLPMKAEPVADEEIDAEFERLIKDRAKRAQQAAEGNTGPSTDPGDKSPSTTSEVDAPTAAGTAPAAAPLPDTTSGLASTIDSLAAVLAGNPVPPPAPKPPTGETSAAQPESGSPLASPSGPKPAVNVATPAVAASPPVAGSADGPALLGPPGAPQ